MATSSEFYDLMNEFGDGKVLEGQEKQPSLSDAHFKPLEPISSYSQPHPPPPQQFQHAEHPAINYNQMATMDSYYASQYSQSTEQSDMDVSVSIRELPYNAHASHQLLLTPFLSPAITPQSVFSQPRPTPSLTDDSGSIAQADFFSPLTSPALMPTRPEYCSPHLGPQLSSSATNSPNTFTTQNNHQRTGSHAGRRGATSEAKANKVRPSPVMKPVSSKLRKSSIKQEENTGSSDNSLSPINLDLDAAAMPPPPPPPTSTSTSTSAPASASTSQQTVDATKLAPVTPASIMNMSSSSGANFGSATESTHSSGTATPSSHNYVHASPSLTPIIPGMNMTPRDFASLSLQADSNYANILTGRSTNPKLIELAQTEVQDNGSKRMSHKVAEQRRRDSLKHSFDDLRGLLPPVVDDDDTGGLSEGRLDLRLEMKDIDSAQINKGVSKVVLLKLANDYISILNHRVGRRDNIIAGLRNEVAELRGATASQEENNSFLHQIDGVEHEIQQAALQALGGEGQQRRLSASDASNQKSGLGRGKGRIRGANKAAKQYLHQATQEKSQQK
ncbi:hypothetical protein E3P99_03793 [Wallemia hederae]|uniref:BHLH domain-containing protein n=1 Tax=Wallemia hederae TaxID=1540922 RepID=A0A4T0FH82_9BASI|nr:hypothetical protein E3P99_03793 [Wallemia hederae]